MLASMPTTVAGLLYIALFGVGSVGGMALLTGMAGWQLRRVATGGRSRAWLAGLAGAFSLVLGIAWGLGLRENVVRGWDSVTVAAFIIQSRCSLSRSGQR